MCKSVFVGINSGETKMRNIKLFATIIFVLSILCTFPVLAQEKLSDPNFADPNAQDVDVVDVNVAKIAASDKLRASYIGQLDYFTHFVLYDLDGEPVAYAIVYSKVGTQPNSLDELEAFISATRLRIYSLSSSIEQISNSTVKSDKEKSEEITALQKQIDIARADLIRRDSFVTVITGAKDTMPTILNHHKGLPTILTKKADSLDLMEVDLAREQNKKLWDKHKYMYKRGSSLALIPQQPNLPDIVQQADIIIKGKVLETQSQWVTDERGKHIYTSVTMHVDERLKGEIQGDRFSFEVVGGTVDDITEFVSDSPSFVKDEEAIVYLEADPSRIIRGTHGKYQIYDGKVYINSNELTVNKFLQILQTLKEDPSAIISLAEKEELTIIPTDQGGGQLPPDQLPEIKKNVP